MRAWESLTEMGQIRRLRALAGRALREYDIDVDDIRLVGGFTNIIFRVNTAGGPYALRVDLHRDHTDRDVGIELAWLTALADETSIDVCTPVSARDGRPFVYAEAPGVPGPRRCVLFEWVPGAPLADKLTTDGYRRLGRLSARLHAHGREYEPPERPMAWDKVFYWPEDVDPVVVFKPEMEHHFTDGRMETMLRAIEIVEPAFAKLEPSEAHIVHGDLHPWNVHRFRSRVIALDFEDVSWAHEIQDIAITLFYMRDHPGYGDFVAAFRSGYESIREWPATDDAQVEQFMAARTLMFVNYVANLRSDPSDYYDVAFPRLAAFVDRFGG